MRIAILGYGQLGRALAVGLVASRRHTVSVWTRSPVRSERVVEAAFLVGDDLARGAADADVVWLAVADRAIGELAGRVAELSPDWTGKVAVHSSGAAPGDVLQPLAARGADTVACHPLRAFPSAGAGSGSPFAGALFTLDGSPRGVEAARQLVAAVGGIAIDSRIADRVLYHLAAAVASNYGLLVREWSARRFESAGLSASDAALAADALLSNALENARRSAESLPLTGPIRRGDMETVRAHLSRLAGHERLAYAALGLLLLDTAAREGPSRGVRGPRNGDTDERMAELLRHAFEETLALEPATRPPAR
jgi:predicted short-subunit dehydrogenase-like oxidoreductase (DUF2520 family)